MIALSAPRALSWMDSAACRGVEDPRFFGPDDEPDDAREAREKQVRVEYCDPCPVGEQCATYALEERLEYGIWGGLGEALRAEFGLPLELPPGVKQCARCQETKPLEQFPPKAGGRDGRVSECRRCRHFVHLRRRRKAS